MSFPQKHNYVPCRRPTPNEEYSTLSAFCEHIRLLASRPDLVRIATQPTILLSPVEIESFHSLVRLSLLRFDGHLVREKMKGSSHEANEQLPTEGTQNF